MPYTINDYPNSMNNLPEEIRIKAIDILNVLLEKKDMDENIAIPISISRAKDWASNRDVIIPKTETDQKTHGANIYVSPYNKGWAVKEEKALKISFTFKNKKEAVNKGREIARDKNTSLIIQRKNGSIQTKISYNK